MPVFKSDSPNTRAFVCASPPPRHRGSNIVERSFRDPSIRRLERGVFRSVPELIAAINGESGLDNPAALRRDFQGKKANLNLPEQTDEIAQAAYDCWQVCAATPLRLLIEKLLMRQDRSYVSIRTKDPDIAMKM